jgi:hypothetical protein
MVLMRLQGVLTCIIIIKKKKAEHFPNIWIFNRADKNGAKK